MLSPLHTTFYTKSLRCTCLGSRCFVWIRLDFWYVRRSILCTCLAHSRLCITYVRRSVRCTCLLSSQRLQICLSYQSSFNFQRLTSHSHPSWLCRCIRCTSWTELNNTCFGHYPFFWYSVLSPICNLVLSCRAAAYWCQKSSTWLIRSHQAQWWRGILSKRESVQERINAKARLKVEQLHADKVSQSVTRVGVEYTMQMKVLWKRTSLRRVWF